MAVRISILVAACLLMPIPATAGEYEASANPSINTPSGKNSEAATTEQPIKVSLRAKAACMPDAVRFCRDALPNVRGVLMCFDQHREQISNRCRTVLASYGLH